VVGAAAVAVAVAVKLIIMIYTNRSGLIDDVIIIFVSSVMTQKI
jgi:hypothetical protein